MRTTTPEDTEYRHHVSVICPLNREWLTFDSSGKCGATEMMSYRDAAVQGLLLTFIGQCDLPFNYKFNSIFMFSSSSSGEGERESFLKQFKARETQIASSIDRKLCR